MLLVLRTGATAFNLSAPCWVCSSGDVGCSLKPNEIKLFGVLGDANATSLVGVPGGGSYKLAYTLYFDGGAPNIFQATIETDSGPAFQPLPFDVLTMSDAFADQNRSFNFTLPSGTTSIRLSFTGGVVQPLVHPAPYFPA